VSDGHKGIQKAVDESFLGASWQMCHVHFVRAVLKNVAKKHQKEMADKLKDALEDETKMQDLALERRAEAIPNPRTPLNVSSSAFGTISRSPALTGKGSGLPTDWKGLTSVTGGLKLLNSGGIKMSSCQSLRSKLGGCVDAGPGGVPHVARFVQRRIEHQRDRQKNRLQSRHD